MPQQQPPGGGRAVPPPAGGQAMPPPAGGRGVVQRATEPTLDTLTYPPLGTTSVDVPEEVYCAMCDTYSFSQREAGRHRKSDEHRKQQFNFLFCDLCQKGCGDVAEMQVHMESGAHQAKFKAILS